MMRLSGVVGVALILGVVSIVNAQAQSVRALVGATISDPSRTPSQFVGTVIIDGERITAVGSLDRIQIPAGAEQIDVRGKFLIPGLIDAHVHFFGVTETGFVPANFDFILEYPRWGVTSVFDFSGAAQSFGHAMQLANEYGPPRARYFGNGPPFSPFNDPEPTAEEIAAGLEATALAGWDVVGVMHDESTFYAPAVLQAILDQSHARSMPVIVQASSRRTAAEALKAGAHALMHGISDVPFDSEFLGLMLRTGAFYVPVHSLFESRVDRIAWIRKLDDFDQRDLVPEATFETLRAGQENASTQSPEDQEALLVLRGNLRRIQEAGIPIAMGTDSGVPRSVPGITSQVELALYVEAGLTAEQALLSATANAARMIGVFDQLGSKEGKFAR